MTTTAANIAELAMEIVIDAPPDTVWRQLTENIGDWWPDDFYAGGSPGRRTFLLEAEAGGRMHESWDGGGGILWGTVICVDVGKRLQVAGLAFPNWGGPAQWFGTWDLEETASTTRLRFSEHSIGRVSAASTTEKESGWHFLWNCLKANVEGRPAPAWED